MVVFTGLFGIRRVHLFLPAADSLTILEQIEGSAALYRHIHQEGLNIGIETIADLKNRIVGPEDHERLWVGYCTRWLKEHDQEAR